MAKPATQIDNVMDNIPYYDKWQLGEGIPIVKTFFVQDLRKIELKSWARTGGNGAFINMEGAEGATGSPSAACAGGSAVFCAWQADRDRVMPTARVSTVGRILILDIGPPILFWLLCLSSIPSDPGGLISHRHLPGQFCYGQNHHYRTVGSPHDTESMDTNHTFKKLIK